MWHAVLGYAGDPEVASDAVAETFAQALRRGTDIRDPRAWVWRTVFRVAGGLLGDRARTAPLPTEGSYEMEMPARELIAALARLTSKQRAAIVLHHGAGFTIRDVAATIGSTSAAVKVHLARGRRRLRELLEDEDA
jgi:RNA polymerase sigma-70 factor (ECF subfamily)